MRRAVQVTSDIVYARARVGVGDERRTAERALRLDLYEPANDTSAARPALLLAFGGAFHRGTKEDDTVADASGSNTPIAEYCRRFASLGYVACSIDYRLVQEDPDPGHTRVVAEPDAIPRSRVDVVRGLLGLGPVNPAQLWRGIEAASDDMAAAFRYVRDHSVDWRIDPARIAVGGFSAGARTALNAAFGERVGAAAVISLSGYMDPSDLARHLDAAGPVAHAPVLVVSAEHDLDYVRDAAPALVGGLRARGVPCEAVLVAGTGHFYPAQALATPERGEPAPLEVVIERFLERHVGTPRLSERVAVATLEAFSEAWNRHDIDALMSFMTDDCIFETHAGSSAHGTRHEGAQAVRAGFESVWLEFPDARWNCATHFVCRDRGVSEWTFTGTRASDGVRVEVAGCDLFTFACGRIRIKNSWRKQRR